MLLENIFACLWQEKTLAIIVWKMRCFWQNESLDHRMISSVSRSCLLDKPWRSGIKRCEKMFSLLFNSINNKKKTFATNSQNVQSMREMASTGAQGVTLCVWPSVLHKVHLSGKDLLDVFKVQDSRSLKNFVLFLQSSLHPPLLTFLRRGINSKVVKYFAWSWYLNAKWVHHNILKTYCPLPHSLLRRVFRAERG